MREATLSGLSDLDALRPRKPRLPAGKTGKTGKASKTPTLGARLRRFRSRATLVIASAGFVAIMVGIVCNAVMFQKGHHPAPLFGTAAEAAKSAPRPAPVAAAEAAPLPVTSSVAAAAPAPAEPVAPAPPPAPVRHAAIHAPARPPALAHRVASAPAPVHHATDAIARLLGQGAPMPLHPATRVRPGQSVAARTVEPAKVVARKIRPAALAVTTSAPVPD